MRMGTVRAIRPADPMRSEFGVAALKLPRGLHPHRIRALNEREVARGNYVLYWMQQSQRAEYNHALEYAIAQANALGLPCLVVFGLMGNYPGANLRHYDFMLQGLRETRRKLAARNIRLVVQHGTPPEVTLRLANHAALIVCDRGYLRHQKAWRRNVARKAGVAVHEVESDVIVPVDRVSEKAEYAARTIRPKLLGLEGEYIEPLRAARAKVCLAAPMQGADIDDVEATCANLSLDRSVPPVVRLKGGSAAARNLFRRFTRYHLPHYGQGRAEPHETHVSFMAPYLHFGQISPVWLAVQVRRGAGAGTAPYIEQLLVRRELAINFVYRTRDYDRYSCLPEWARKTLRKHARDKRSHLYSRRQLEGGKTHDDAWNAAMLEMKHTGYLHNRMRMYWGKQILAWSSSPEQAYRTALYLNNKYFLDGRDANSFANVGWLFGLHDRPWQENAVFGNVRTMTRSGLDRKIDVAAYVTHVRRVTDMEKGGSHETP
jgi:deoxyribodipyrimidine photo-lyase